MVMLAISLANVGEPNEGASFLSRPRREGLDSLGGLACAIDNAGGWYRGTGRSSRRQQVRRRSRGLGLILLLHAFFEGLDPLGEIAQYAGQLPGTEQNDDNGQDYDPMHQTERTHRTN